MVYLSKSGSRRVLSTALLWNQRATSMMKAPRRVPFLLLALSTFSTTNGLPFNIRGKDKNNSTTTSPKAEATIDGGEIKITLQPIPKDINHDNDAVDSYFQDRSQGSEQLQQSIRESAASLHDFLIATRRTLHRHPELMYRERITSQVVQRLLTEMGIEFSVGWARNIHSNHYEGAEGGHGIVADIGTGHSPCVLLRADMDALPIHEQTPDIDFQSQIPNTAHMCGHDGHTTMLLGAASLLKSMEDRLPGTVRLVFQPAEEGGAGGKRMREEGVLEKTPKPSFAFGLHVWPTLESGTIAASPGPWMAACERFEILVHGVGGHAAMPHLTIDPIVAGSAIVMNLQTIVSRTLSPLEAGVCSITQFDAGSGAFNVIPNSVVLKGTIRALSTERLLEIRDRVAAIVEMTAQTHGCNTTIEYSPDYYPVTVNDPWLLETFAKDVGSLVAKDGMVQNLEPSRLLLKNECILEVFLWLTHRFCSLFC